MEKPGISTRVCAPRERKSTSGSAADPARSVAGISLGERATGIPCLNSAAHDGVDLWGAMADGELATIQKGPARERSEIREILIKRRPDEAARGRASSLIYRIPRAFCPCSVTAIGQVNST